MAKILRKNQKIFGQNALAGQIGVYGSLSAGSPTTTTDPETIQSLSNYLGGWFSGVVGSNSPAIEDMNALHYLYAYQLAYLMQAGIPEYDVNTTYYINSYVQSSGVIYKSLTDNNLGNAVSNATHWQVGFSNSSLAKMTDQTIKGNVSGISAVPSDLSAQDVRSMIYAQPTVQKFTSGSGTYTTPANVKFLKIKMVGGGGGGGGGGASGGGTGGNGGNTTFGSSLLTANGGNGGSFTVGGIGGTATVNSPAVSICSFQGGDGTSGVGATIYVTPITAGQAGAYTPFGGAGGGNYISAGSNAISNTGSGGGSGSANGSVNGRSGGSGGAGGYIEAIINAPSSSYSWSIGSSGTAGTAGSNGYAGGAGGSGIIIVEEYYL